jgi:hypothetical protein
MSLRFRMVFRPCSAVETFGQNPSLGLETGENNYLFLHGILQAGCAHAFPF